MKGEKNEDHSRCFQKVVRESGARCGVREETRRSPDTLVYKSAATGWRMERKTEMRGGNWWRRRRRRRRREVCVSVCI